MIRLSSLIHISDTIRIGNELGTGGSGAVYKAWHIRLKKHVVVKEVKYCAVERMEARRNETEALKNVKSMFLPQVYDFMVEGDRAFTVMEYIDGESFDKLLMRGESFTALQISRWYEQLASALDTIHGQEICHCDVKPANIMLTPKGDVCLIDFSAALVGGNESKFISRSLGYASPEQYEAYQRVLCSSGAKSSQQSAGDDKPEYVETQAHSALNLTEYTDEYGAFETCGAIADASSRIDWKRSDIYSLGATMYHISTGTPPPAQSHGPITHTELEGVDEHIAYIIEKSMKYDPAERFESVWEIVSELRGAQIAQRVQSGRKPRNVQNSNKARKKRGRAKKTAAIVAVLIIAALIASRVHS